MTNADHCMAIRKSGRFEQNANLKKKYKNADNKDTSHGTGKLNGFQVTYVRLF